MGRKKSRTGSRKQESRDGGQVRGSRGSSAQAATRRRRLTILAITLVSLCGVLLAGWMWVRSRARPSPTVSGGQQTSDKSSRGSRQTDPLLDAGGRLLPARTMQTAPVNRLDPLDGKPITPMSPTTIYKGYIVAFCCPNSKSYNGGWARMSESEKDAFVLSWLRRGGGR